ncbi:MAG: hypothetical protein ACRYG4_17910 [Janthinobacterium lividum]
MAEYETRSVDAAGNPVVVERTVVRERSNNMGWLIALLIIVALVVAAFAFKLINIDQTQAGSLPTVKVDTAGGSLPKFNVDTAKVDVGTKKTDVTTPTVSVGTKTTGIDVPTISVEKADADKK